MKVKTVALTTILLFFDKQRKIKSKSFAFYEINIAREVNSIRQWLSRLQEIILKSIELMP